MYFVLQKFGGSFVNVIAECHGSAVKLLQLIIDNFPTFRDVATFNGKTGTGDLRLYT